MSVISKVFKILFVLILYCAGPTAIIAMTVGFLVSGCVISKFKPRPTYVLGWNVLVGFSFVIGEILFIFLKCDDGTLMGYRHGSDRYITYVKNIL